MGTNAPTKTDLQTLAARISDGIYDESFLIKLALKEIEASGIPVSPARALVKSLERCSDELFDLSQRLVDLANLQARGGE